MDKTLKNIINKIIDREYEKVSEELLEIMEKSPQLVKDYEKYGAEQKEIMGKLFEIVPKEYHELIDDFQSITNVLIGVETRAAFKEGLILGVTELNYLSEVGLELAII